MKYYIVKESLDKKIVGSDYPQVYKFIKGYNENAPHALFSLYEYKESFPDYMPELDGLMLAGYAKLTDFVSSSFSGFLYIVSERTKNIFEQYHLCPHRFYPLGLYKRRMKYDYFLLQTILPDYINYVDFEKSSFVEYDLYRGKTFGSVSLSSKKELFQEREKLKKSENKKDLTIWGKDIVMNPLFDKELDFFQICWIDANLYISERLKNAVESAGLTGWNFVPATHLFVE